jgi:ABC-type branched-subunit amino acid transport system ATPase component
MELFDSMTVDENLVVATEARLVGAKPQRQLFSTAAERTHTRAAVDDAIEACGLGDVRRELAGTLSTGSRRLVELARACAAGFRLLLLDEPSSGLDGEETERLGAILRGLVDERGVGILLVEHDMTLVMDVCEHLFVLDFGTLVFEGTAAAAQTSDVVRAAYLGSESGLEAAESEHFAAEEVGA